MPNKAQKSMADVCRHSPVDVMLARLWESERSSCPCRFVDTLIPSNKRGEAGDGGPGSWGQAAGGPIKRAVLAGRVGALLGGCGSPAALGSKETASLRLALRGGGAELRGERGQWRQRGQRRRRGAVLFGLSGLRLGVVVGLRSRDSLLLPAPGVVVGGIADVVVDEGMGFLSVGVHLVLAVASLRENDRERIVMEMKLFSRSYMFIE